MLTLRLQKLMDHGHSHFYYTFYGSPTVYCGLIIVLHVMHLSYCLLTLCTLCSFRSKQPHQDPLEEVVWIQFQKNSRVVC